MYKVGDVYSTYVNGRKHHPVVIMEPEDKELGMRIKAVGFSHSSKLNLQFEEKLIVPCTAQNGYTFKWEEYKNGRKTSLMPFGFNKKIAYLDKKIGEINEDGIKYIRTQVVDYIDCDKHVSTTIKKKKTNINH